jgi:hypothetical protein
MTQEDGKIRIKIEGSSQKEEPVTEESSLAEVLTFVENTKQNQIKEFTLPAGISFDVLFLKIGETKRSHELGGFFDPISRKVKVTRSLTNHSVYGATGEGLPNIGYHNQRDESGKIIGHLWHTHPSEIQEEVYKKRYQGEYKPEINCTPSDPDNTVIFSTSLSEAVDGNSKVFRSIIAASGFVSETRAEGLSLDLDKLKVAGCDEDSIQRLLVSLTYSPSPIIRNYAKEGKEDELFVAIQNYYKKKQNRDGSFYRELDTFIVSIKDLLTERLLKRMTTTADKVVRDLLYYQFADYPSRRQLETFGFQTKEQQDLVLGMLGLKQIYIS